MQRLLVLAKLKDEYGEPMVSGFQMSLSKGLAACGVLSRIVVVGSGEMFTLRAEEASREFGPDAYLEIQIMGGEAYKYSDRVESLIIIQLQIIDLTAQKLIWLARAKLGTKTNRNPEAGSEFADSIVLRLRGDRFLKDCR
jgi:hypothetical protein